MITTRKPLPADIASRFARAGLGDANSGTVVPKALQLYPWWLYKPPIGQDIVALAQNAFIAAGTVTLAGLTKSFDQNTMAIIRGIDLYINSMTPSVIVSFALLINGAAVPGYGNMAMFPRTAASVNQSFDTFIFVPAGGQVSVTVTNADGATYLVGAGYQGWSVPVNIDDILGINSRM